MDIPPARSHSRRQGLRWLVAVPLGLIAVGIVGVPRLRELTAHCHRVWISPGGAYRLVLYRMPLPFSMPGGASDAPGFVRLQTRTGQTLAREPVEMVQLADAPEWHTDRIEIPLIVTWTLPRPEPALLPGPNATKAGSPVSCAEAGIE